MSNQSPAFLELLAGCEREQLHLSGAIQSFGALRRVELGSGCVTHASANLEAFLPVTPATILGRPVGECRCLPASLLDHLPAQPGQSSSVVLPTPLEGSGQAPLHARLIHGNHCALVELEKSGSAIAPVAVQQFQRPLLTIPANAGELLAHQDVLVQAFRAVGGFDRVMLYRFREDWTGEVVAEARAEGMGSYAGLRFPASDIPAIARNLYMMNPSRMIPDVAAAPVPILSREEGEVPDLTWSDLRSVSPVHLEYLGNMGVGASFSVPIRVAGRLWGLVACHHLGARLLSPDQRQACENMAGTHALALTSYLAGKRLQAIDSLERRTEKLLSALAQHDDPLDGIEPNSQLLMEMLSATGFAMAIGNDVVISGDAPDFEGMSVIDNWFLNEGDTVCCTEHLEALFPSEIGLLACASGFMAIKARSQRSGWVRFYWFRPQEPEEVAWAGNPDKPVVENAGALRLSPRRSFERWVEIRTGYSRPWSSEEKMTAAKFRNTLLRWL